MFNYLFCCLICLQLVYASVQLSGNGTMSMFNQEKKCIIEIQLMQYLSS